MTFIVKPQLRSSCERHVKSLPDLNGEIVPLLQEFLAAGGINEDFTKEIHELGYFYQLLQSIATGAKTYLNEKEAEYLRNNGLGDTSGHISGKIIQISAMALEKDSDLEAKETDFSKKILDIEHVLRRKLSYYADKSYGIKLDMKKFYPEVREIER
jgi:hypothetical protein